MMGVWRVFYQSPILSQMKDDPHAVRLDTSLELLAERLSTSREACVIATVVFATGSTYRKPGARMLVEGDGRITGLLSGGCFEQDLREHARGVLETGAARTVTYDMRTDDDLIFGIGAGCEGRMGILLEPSSPGDANRRAIVTASAMAASGQPLVLVSIYHAPEAARGTFLWHARSKPALNEPLATACLRALEHRHSGAISWAEAGSTRDAWIQVVLRPPSVLVCGAGLDAEPLVASFTALRYPVTVVDHRAAHAISERFPGATVVLGSPTSLSSRLDLDSFFAAVVMSHHLDSDATYLRWLAPTSIQYIGLLGPRPRRDRLLQQVGSAAADIRGRLHAPVGLDIGAITPEGIALAIAAEVHAAAAGRMGGAFPIRRHLA
jgi:xanthine dehydrogenase accessory factor